MKIAFIYDVIYPYIKGGAEKRFWELAKRLSIRGHEVHMFGMKSWAGKNLLVKEGVYLHGVCKHRNLYLKNGKRSLRQVLCFAFSIFRPLFKERFDLIECNAFPYLPFFPVKLYSALNKIPLVTTWQEVWGKYWCRYLGCFKGTIGMFIEIMVVKLSDCNIVHSLKTKNELLKFGTAEENIRLSKHGVDLKIIDNTPENHEKSDIFFAGRLIKDKNVDVLIRAVYLVRQEFDSVRCLIVGEGPERPRLIKLVESLGLGKNVIIMNFLEYRELISYMKSAKIFVFPSAREGFGIVVIEAMACGLPVITVRHPMNAATELVHDERNGFVCELEDKDIAHRIVVILKDKMLREKFSIYAKDYAKRFDWEEVVSSMESFYKQVINKHI